MHKLIKQYYNEEINNQWSLDFNTLSFDTKYKLAQSYGFALWKLHKSIKEFTISILKTLKG